MTNEQIISIAIIVVAWFFVVVPFFVGLISGFKDGYTCCLVEGLAVTIIIIVVIGIFAIASALCMLMANLLSGDPQPITALIEQISNLR